MSNDMFTELEAKLSPAAKHAYEAYLIGLWREDQCATIGQLRTAITLIYGKSVDEELERYTQARREAVLPK